MQESPGFHPTPLEPLVMDDEVFTRDNAVEEDEASKCLLSSVTQCEQFSTTVRTLVQLMVDSRMSPQKLEYRRSMLSEFMWHQTGFLTQMLFHSCSLYSALGTYRRITLRDCHFVTQLTFLLNVMLQERRFALDLVKSRLVLYLTPFLGIDASSYQIGSPLRTAVEQMQLSLFVSLISITHVLLMKQDQAPDSTSLLESFLALKSGSLLVDTIRCLSRTSSEMSLQLQLLLLRRWFFSFPDNLTMTDTLAGELQRGLHTASTVLAKCSGPHSRQTWTVQKSVQDLQMWLEFYPSQS